MAEIIRSMNLVSVFKQEKGVKRFFMMIFSILLMGFGISLFSYSDMGGPVHINEYGDKR